MRDACIIQRESITTRSRGDEIVLYFIFRRIRILHFIGREQIEISIDKCVLSYPK